MKVQNLDQAQIPGIFPTVEDWFRQNGFVLTGRRWLLSPSKEAKK